MRKRTILLSLFGGVALLIGGGYGFVEATAKLEHPHVEHPDIKASDDPAVIKHGEYLVHNVAHCSTCHTAAGDGTANTAGYPRELRRPLSGGLTIVAGPFGTFRAANITPDPDTGIGKHTDGELARIIRHGVAKDDALAAVMARVAGPMSDEDLQGIISYLRAQEPVVNKVGPSEIGFVGKLVSRNIELGTATGVEHVPAGGISVERGKYLAEGPAVCVVCHTRADPLNGFAYVGDKFSGGDTEPDPTNMDYVITPPNITTGGRLAAWSEDDFVKRIKAGRVDVMQGSKMPWEAFQGMTEEDIRSIYRYLKTVPASDWDPGESRREG